MTGQMMPTRSVVMLAAAVTLTLGVAARERGPL